MVMSTQQLQQELTGGLLLPDDPRYEEIRRGWNRTIDQRPALILLAHNAQDIALGLRYAREAGLGISVQLTGHGIQHPADDGLLIVTSAMTAVQIDAQARTARVEAGALWQHVLDQATPHGLAPLLGTSPHVGVVGYTLGGGIGWLSRRYGFAADSVRWIEIVTADGQLRRASPTKNSELFWGLRGGGGNFGVVTAMEFDLYPVATFYGGNLIYPAELASPVLRFFRDWTATAPDELASSIALMKYPALPQLPEEIRGKKQVLVRAVFAGDAAAGARLIQPWLDWQAPASNTFQQMPFAAIGTVNNDPVEPRAAYGSNELFDTLSDEALDLMVRYTFDDTSPLIFSELRHAGGAIARGDADASPVGNRDASFYLLVNSAAPTPEARTALQSYIQQYKAELQPYLQGGVYQNFLMGDEARQRTQDAYTPDVYRRLRALKTQYDPENLFRYSYQLGA
jgi:FAD/FMN-containing dehydrogenase